MNNIAETGTASNSAPIFEPGSHDYSHPLGPNLTLLFPNFDDPRRYAWNPECADRIRTLNPPVKRIAIDSIPADYGDLTQGGINWTITFLPDRPSKLGIEPTMIANQGLVYQLFVLAGDCGFLHLSENLQESMSYWLPNASPKQKAVIESLLNQEGQNDTTLGAINSEEVIDDTVIIANTLGLASLGIAMLQKLDHAGINKMSRRHLLIRMGQGLAAFTALFSGFAKLYSDVAVSTQRSEVTKDLLMKLDSIDFHLSSSDATTFLSGRTALLTQKLVDGFTYFQQPGSNVVLMGDAHVVDADTLMTDESERIKSITKLGQMYARLFTQSVFKAGNVPQAQYAKFLETIAMYLASYSIIQVNDNGLPYGQGGNLDVQRLGYNLNPKIYAALCQAFNIPNNYS